MNDLGMAAWSLVIAGLNGHAQGSVGANAYLSPLGYKPDRFRPMPLESPKRGGVRLCRGPMIREGPL